MIELDLEAGARRVVKSNIDATTTFPARETKKPIIRQQVVNIAVPQRRRPCSR